MTNALCNNIRCGRVTRGATGRSRSVVVRCSGAPVAPPVLSKEILYANLGVAYEDLRRAPPSEKFKFSAGILECMTDLKSAGANPKWGASADSLSRRSVFQGELRQVGIKNPEKIAIPSIRNDAAFLVTVTLSTSLVAVVAGAVLPGDWGFFTSCEDCCD